jgi:hypothetical protein
MVTYNINKILLIHCILYDIKISMLLDVDVIPKINNIKINYFNVFMTVNELLSSSCNKCKQCFNNSWNEKTKKYIMIQVKDTILNEIYNFEENPILTLHTWKEIN